MSLLAGFWRRICEPLDGFLWRRDISHPIIRPLLRNEILAAASCLLGGAVLYAAFPWLFWFGAGLLCMAWIFWGWARFFSHSPLGEYSAAFLRSILFRFGGRLLALALGLYLALAQFRAPPGAILAGLGAGAFIAFASYAWAPGRQERR